MPCSEADYAYLRDIVQSESANRIDPARNASFETRLTPVAQLAGVPTVDGLVDPLRVDQTTQLHRAVAEAMTINETSFFRDRGAFDALRETILPRLIEQNSAQRKLRIWSAASSSGQEAYSLAILLCESFPQLAGWDIKIIGTDISRQVVDQAQRGRYRRLDINRGLPARMLVKYFTRDGEEWEVAPQLRALCDFRCANLCVPLPSLPTFDLVLLRNVLLYFSPADRTRVFAAVHRQIAPSGYLLLGASEQAEDSTSLFRAQFIPTCYFYRPAP
jgi:chemotaxis protein methyltransferase CheR